MSDIPVSEALEQVRRLQAVVRDRLRFRGFSARARIIGGLVALLGAVLVQQCNDLPAVPRVHLMVWLAVAGLAAAVNYGALLLWLVAGSRWRRPDEWLPAIEALPALVAGAAITWALARNHAYDLLPGAWMTSYGLVHMAYRRNLHLANYGVGLLYLLAGLLFLLLPGVTFTDPRPMGLVFGLGELAGGLALAVPDRLLRSPREALEP